MNLLTIRSRLLRPNPALAIAGSRDGYVIAACAGIAMMFGFGMYLRSGTDPVPEPPALSTRDIEAMSVADPRNLMPIAPVQAIAVNRAIPIAAASNPAAEAFLANMRNADAQARSLHCLTSAIYYEAANEPTDGQRGVAQVVLNRVRHPAYPNSICGVVFQGSQRRTGCQFSFTCDGSLRRRPSAASWDRARRVAQAALSGQVYSPVGYSTHYHANYVVPYWASSLLKTATIGAHIFYRFTGRAGTPRAFTARYTGVEPGIVQPAVLGEATEAEETARIPVSLTLSTGWAEGAAVSEDRAEALDDFGLLQARRAAPVAARMRDPDAAVGSTVSAAVGTSPPDAAPDPVQVASNRDSR